MADGGCKESTRLKAKDVGTPAKTALGRVELWKNMGCNARINPVLDNFESAGCERNGAT